MIGHVKHFDGVKNWGFLHCEDGGDVFVHGSAVRGIDPKKLQKGDLVSFDIEKTDRGPRAVDVHLAER